MKHSKNQYKYAVGRLKKCNDKIQNDKFIAGVLQNKKNIFDEIRKFWGKNNNCSSRIDSEVGSDDIALHFT